MIIEIPKRWYAVHTGARSETIADQHLRRQGFMTFYPFNRIKRRRKIPNQDNFRLETIEVPYMPRYLFVLAQPGEVSIVNDTQGVATVVKAPLSNRPLPIPDSVMDDLMQYAGEEGLMIEEDLTQRSLHFDGKVGESFSFAEDTPFSGLIAAIESLEGLDERGEIVAVLTMLGSKRSITVPASAVGKIVNA